MVNVLKAWLVKMGRNGGMTLLNSLDVLRRRCHFILIVVVIALTSEILGTFVFVRRTELNDIRCQQLCARPRRDGNESEILTY